MTEEITWGYPPAAIIKYLENICNPLKNCKIFVDDGKATKEYKDKHLYIDDEGILNIFISNKEEGK